MGEWDVCHGSRRPSSTPPDVLLGHRSGGTCSVCGRVIFLYRDGGALLVVDHYWPGSDSDG